MHTISHHHQGMQAKCKAARPGSESGAKTRMGILESWESRPALITHHRIRMTPVYQRPGAELDFSTNTASETLGKVWASASEGNRSKRTSEDGSLSGLIVAFESRVTHRREPVSSEGDCQGEERAIEPNGGEILPRRTFPQARGI